MQDDFDANVDERAALRQVQEGHHRQGSIGLTRQLQLCVIETDEFVVGEGEVRSEGIEIGLASEVLARRGCQQVAAVLLELH